MTRDIRRELIDGQGPRLSRDVVVDAEMTRPPLTDDEEAGNAPGPVISRRTAAGAGVAVLFAGFLGGGAASRLTEGREQQALIDRVRRELRAEVEQEVRVEVISELVQSATKAQQALEKTASDEAIALSWAFTQSMETGYPARGMYVARGYIGHNEIGENGEPRFVVDCKDPLLLALKGNIADGQSTWTRNARFGLIDPNLDMDGNVQVNSVGLRDDQVFVPYPDPDPTRSPVGYYSANVRRLVRDDGSVVVEVTAFDPTTGETPQDPYGRPVRPGFVLSGQPGV